MISGDFAFFGFDETSWGRLVSLILGEKGERPRGVLVVIVNAERMPVACFHTAAGSIDLSALPRTADLEALCEAMDAAAGVMVRERAMDGLEDYLAEPLDPEKDFAARVMRFAHLMRELGDGNWLRVWPNPLPSSFLSFAPAAKPAIELILPDERNLVLGVFEDGELWTGAVLRRRDGALDVLAGPAAMSEWAGPLGGAWRRDHRVVTRAIERELGPVHIGLFMERSTAELLLSRRRAGDWAAAYAIRELVVQPLPVFAAAGLSADVLGGLAQSALQAFAQMDADEAIHIAQGFWRGLTDGKGLAGLLGLTEDEPPDEP